MRRAVIWISIVVLCGSFASAQRASQQDAALQAAIRTETVDGDLRKAIAQYEAIAKAGDRTAAAKALLRMAECYQKLGDTQARSTYERLVRDFADQTEAVAAARVRLGATGRDAGIVARQLWSTSGYTHVTVGPDGRVAAITEGGSNDVILRDLVTLDVTRLNLSDPSGAYPESPVLSPDSKQLAYTWSGPEIKWNYQIRIGVPRPGTKGQPLGELFAYASVHGWSRDGRSVLVSAIDAKNTARLGWMSTTDGTFNILKTLPRWSGRPSLSPDGRFIAYEVGADNGTNRQVRVLRADGGRESIVVDGPSVNSWPVWSRDGSRLVFTSDRSGSFGLWSVAVRDGERNGPPMSLKANIGNVTLYGFTAAGALLYSQAVGTRDVYTAALDPEGATLIGDRLRMIDTYVGSNLNPSQSPDGKSLAYLSVRIGIPAGGYVGTLIIRSLDTGAERVIATPFRYASKPLWSSDGQTIIELARNATNTASIYRVDVKTGTVTEILATDALSPPWAELSPDNQTLYVQADGRFVAYNLATKSRSTIWETDRARVLAVRPDGKSIAFVTTSESPTGARLYLADPDGRNARAILTAGAKEGPPRAIAWDPEGRFIYFSQQNSLLRIPADGGTPSRVGDLGTSPAQSLELSRDGQRIFYSVGGTASIEVWALENLEASTRASR